MKTIMDCERRPKAAWFTGGVDGADGQPAHQTMGLLLRRTDVTIALYFYFSGRVALMKLQDVASSD
jgi:hypothetical protein